MKNKFTYILAGLLLMSAISFPVKSSAQSTGSVPAGIVLNKTVAADPSNPYKYNLSLESYVTGSSTTEISVSTPPADIILVLDASGSMSESFGGSGTRMDALKSAATEFIQKIGDAAIETGVTHKIGIIDFANQGHELNQLTDVTKAANVNTLKQTINNLSPGNATMAHNALWHAYSMMSGRSVKTYVDPKDGRTKDRNQVVLFFTDGIPGEAEATYEEGGDIFGYASLGNSSSASRAIYYSNLMKYGGAVVFTIGIHPVCDPSADINFSFLKNSDIRGYGEEPVYATKSKAMNAYMHFVSSDYPYNPNVVENSEPHDVNNYIDTYQSNSNIEKYPRDKVENNGYYFSANNASALGEIFLKIAEKIESYTTGGADYEGLTATTSKVVDKIGDGFTLPAGTTASNIGLYVAKCNSVSGTEGSFSYGFADRVAATSVFPNVKASISGKSITVDGYDFSDNYVGPDYTIMKGSTTMAPHGYKLIVTIPIEIDPSGNPGGASVNTNAPGSGIYKDNTVIGDFTSPSVCIPNILIVKRGLHKGESAIFKVSSNTGSTPFTVKVTCTEEGSEAIGIIKIQKPGRWTVEETDWSWAHDVNVPDNFYTKDDSSVPTVISGASITRNVNELTEETYSSKKGTLFVFNNPDRTTSTPAHGEAVTSNYFNSATGSVSVATE